MVEIPQTGLGWIGFLLNAVAIAETVQVLGADWEQKWRRLSESIEANRRPITSCAASSEWALARRKMKSVSVPERDVLERRIAELEDFIRRNKNDGDVSSLQSQLSFLQFQSQALGDTLPASHLHSQHVSIRNMASADSSLSMFTPDLKDVSPERRHVVAAQFRKVLKDHPWLQSAEAHVGWMYDITQYRFEPELHLRRPLNQIAASEINSQPDARDPRYSLRVITHVLQRANDLLDQLNRPAPEHFKLVIHSSDVVELVRWSVIQERHLIEDEEGRTVSGLEWDDQLMMADLFRLAGRLLVPSKDKWADDPIPFLILDAAARRYQGMYDTAKEGSSVQKALSCTIQDLRQLLEGAWNYPRAINNHFDFVYSEVRSYLFDLSRTTAANETMLPLRLDRVAGWFRLHANLGLYHVAFLGQCLLGLFAKALLQDDQAKEIFELATYYYDRAKRLGMLNDADLLMAIDGEYFFASAMKDAGIPRKEVGDVPKALSKTWLPHKLFIVE